MALADTMAGEAELRTKNAPAVTTPPSFDDERRLESVESRSSSDDLTQPAPDEIVRPVRRDHSGIVADERPARKWPFSPRVAQVPRLGHT